MPTVHALIAATAIRRQSLGVARAFSRSFPGEPSAWSSRDAERIPIRTIMGYGNSDRHTEFGGIDFGSRD
jgi:hypothetical protein